MLISITFFSCGARKVNKSDIKEEIKTESSEVVKTDTDSTSNIKIETVTKIDESTKEEIEETVFTVIDNNKPAVFGKDTITNGQLVKRKIKRNKALISSNNTNVSNDIKKTNTTTKQSEKEEQAKKNVETKYVEREQYSFITVLWWLWLIILIVLWRVYVKYRNKLLP